MFLGGRVYGVSPSHRAGVNILRSRILSPHLIVPRDLEWGQWADRGTTDYCRRSCVDQTAPSPASWEEVPPAFSPRLAQDEHQGPNLRFTPDNSSVITISLLLRLYWRGPRPRNEHTFIMRGKLNQPPRSPTPPPTHHRHHYGSLVTAGAGAAPSNRGSGWLNWLAGQNGPVMNCVGGCTLINGLICLTLIIESCHLTGSWGRHPPLPTSSDKPGS